MKNFLTSMLGTLAALAIFALGTTVVFLGLLGIIVAVGSKKAPTLTPGSYLVFDLSTNISDAPPQANFNLLSFGSLPRTLQLHTITRALRLAAGDDRIAGVLIEGSLQSDGYASGFAALREVRNALQAVRDAGKPVKAYLTTASTRDYYVASVANEVIMDPFGTLEMPGLASEPMFFAGAFEKYGVNVQIARVGKYKSAVEPFVREDMSPESREQTQALMDDIWGGMIAEMGSSRNLPPATVQAVVDREGILRADVAQQDGLIDRSAYLDEVIAELTKETGPARDDRNTFRQIGLAQYAGIARGPEGPAGKSGDATAGGRGTIAVVYAEGEIVDGEGTSGEVGGDRYAREIRKLRQDDSVKAIVLRINSPGGSASAAEAIEHEVERARAVKPVIVSMGSYAASGGYWIATHGSHIFAEPSSITGSIGVFGIQFDVKELANRLGITFDSVKTGHFADAMTITRPKTPEELEVVQRLVDWIYGEFIDRVSDGRKLPRDRVEEIAQGRVWSGLEARQLGLVDEIGGLGASLQYAASQTGLGSNYSLREFPSRNEYAALLGQMLSDLAPSGATAPRGLTGQVVQRVETELKTLQSFNDPAGVYARLPFNLELR